CAQRGVRCGERHREGAADSRYFPEPDLVPVTVSRDEVAAVSAAMGELPQAQRHRLEKEYGLTPYDAQGLAAKGRKTVAYFETVAKALGDGKAAANRMGDVLYAALAERKEEIDVFPIPAAGFVAYLKA